MTTPPPLKRWLTYGDVKRKIESCIGTSGEYTLRLWTEGSDPVLPRHYFPGRKWAAYDPDDVARLLKPYQKPTPPHA